MKLAEALQERSDLNRNIEQLKKRLSNNVLVQEGEQPAEEPQQLKQELDISLRRLAYLIAQINLTNCATKIGEQTLTELIAQKDTLVLKIGIYKDIVYAAGEIKKQVSVPVFAVNGIRTPEDARGALELTQVDMIDVGRGSLANPNWAADALAGRETDTCLDCSVCQWRIDPARCAGRLLHEKRQK